MLPAFVFLLVSPPPHPFRLWRGAFPGGPPLSAELPVQHRGPSLKATEAILSLAGISEAIGLPAPEMPPAVRQVELRCLLPGSRALEPPSPPPKGRHGPKKAYPVVHDEVALPIVARLVDQFHEGAARIGSSKPPGAGSDRGSARTEEPGLDPPRLTVTSPSLTSRAYSFGSCSMIIPASAKRRRTRLRRHP